jgi:hypothetical protein
MFSAFKKTNQSKRGERGYFEKLASGLMLMMLAVSVSSILASGSLFIWLFQEQLKTIMMQVSSSWYAFGVVCAAFLLMFVGFIDINRRWAKALETSSENAAAILHAMKAQDTKAQAPQIFVVPGQASAFGGQVIEGQAAMPRLQLAPKKSSSKKSAFVF